MPLSTCMAYTPTSDLSPSQVDLLEAIHVGATGLHFVLNVVSLDDSCQRLLGIDLAG